MRRIAVASRSFSRHPRLREELASRFPDFNITFNDAGRALSGGELLEFLGGHERAIIGLERLDGAAFSALPDLKVISKYGVGFDMLDLAAMGDHGVQLGWTGGVNKRAVAELVVSFAISLLRHVPQSDHETSTGTWTPRIGRQLTGKTVGIIGCGNVGKDLVRLLQPFDCRVLAHDIRVYAEFYAAHGVSAVGLDELLSTSEIVTLHVPLDDSTANILSAQKLSVLRRDAILINAARGGLVDERALKQMLLGGDLAGAAFDVFATEPPEDMELLSLASFLATPHIGGSSEEAVLAMGRAAIDGLADYGDPEHVLRS